MKGRALRAIGLAAIAAALSVEGATAADPLPSWAFAFGGGAGGGAAGPRTESS